MNKTIRFGVSLPEELIDAFDRTIRRKGYTTRSEAVRDLMRSYLVEEEWESGEDEVVATVTIVYDHHTRELSHILNHLQHDSCAAVVCSTHVHMDAHHCLEVIILRGKRDEIELLGNRLISTRGVIHGRLVCSSTGGRLK